MMTCSYTIPLVAFFLLIISAPTSPMTTDTKSKGDDAHIVYMGHSSGEPKATKAAHVKLLEDVLGSPLAAREAMLYSYKHGFSGFAARLTEAQAETIAAMPEVVYVSKSRKLKLHTTRSWDFLGLSLGAEAQPPQYGKMGEGSIIGLIDTGVWPESPSFKDEAMGPVPKRWRGICQSGEQFNASHCNRKLIGARFFSDGAGPAAHFYGSFLSPRDSIGHGTHTASTAGGSVVPGVSYQGLARGVARGGATRARLAVYKVCWMETCDESDILKAFDMAIHDGVDIISISIGREVPLFPNGDHRDSISVGSYHAVARGVTVVASAGNGGPYSYSVVNVAPWLITVGACTTDRRFLATFSLGDNSTLWGQSWYTGKALDGFREITYPESKGLDNNACGGGSLDGTVTGKIVLCFKTIHDIQSMSTASDAVAQAGGVGLIYAQSRDDNQVICSIPCVKVDMEVGTRTLTYIRQSRTPMAKLGAPSNFISTVASPRVAFFSSRGPNSLSPRVLKPDIVAPGVDILAASIPIHGVVTYKIDSGTSMSTPHVAGIVALIKAEHPDWSPGAIRSALITTAWSSRTGGDNIRDGGVMDKVTDMFDIGGGLVNPIKCLDPGLVYNTTMEDYHLTPNQDLLNLPYIIIPNLGITNITVTRTVTNVGANESVYKQTVKAPFGTTMKVEPRTLYFNGTKTATFWVSFARAKKLQGGFNFGSLTWSDGHHRVRIPVAVRVIDFGVFGDVLLNYCSYYVFV